eukprot:364934-Chlamydomonas_euryale.AAC.7
MPDVVMSVTGPPRRQIRASSCAGGLLNSVGFACSVPASGVWGALGRNEPRRDRMSGCNRRLSDRQLATMATYAGPLGWPGGRTAISAWHCRCARRQGYLNACTSSMHYGSCTLMRNTDTQWMCEKDAGSVHC